MRPRKTAVKWKTIHIEIEISEVNPNITASKQLNISKEEFLSKVAEDLKAKGYIPRESLELMKHSFKSPFSQSEYYTFLKVENESYIKVVLDLRLSDHPLNDYGNYTGRERHLYHMKTQTLPEIANEFNFNYDDNSDTEFSDVIGKESTLLTIISVDGTLFTSYLEAYDFLHKKIQELP